MPSFLGTALVVFAFLAFWAAPALAIETHPFTGITIGPGGKSAAGQFTDLTSVAVDPATEDLYVLDTANNGRLYKFDSEGEPLDFTGTGTNFIEGTGGFNGAPTVVNQVAVAPPGAAGGTAGDIYIANSAVVKIYSPAGIEIGQLTEMAAPCGVAVGAAGGILVKSALGNNFPFVTEYTPVTNPPTKAGTSPVELGGESCNLAVDGNGHIYVANSLPEPPHGEEQNPLWRLQSLTATAKELFDPNSSTVAVEPVTNDVYTSRASEVLQYAEDGSLISRFGEHRLIQSPGVSVGEANGNVYVSNRVGLNSSLTYFGRVDVFGPLTLLPEAIAGAAGEIGKTSAILHGTISADGGPPATCEFQYATQSAYEAEGFESAASAPCGPAGPFSGNSTEAVSAEVSGLAKGEKYRFRLVGENENGSLGSDENGSAPDEVLSFETVPAFKVLTGPAEGVTTTTAALSGSINPEGVSVEECFFEYGKTAAYGTTIPCEIDGGGEVGNGNAPVAVHAALTGLTDSTEYHFRLVGGSSEFGGTKVPGTDVVFATQGPPEILSQAFSGVGQNTATISGSINPHSSPTSYFVEYVTQAAWEESGYATATHVPAAGMSIGSGFAPVEVDQTLFGLTPGTTYHFRLYAENGIDHGEGLDETFRTYVADPVFGPCPANESFRVEASALLPDCRAYEQASPPNKNGGSAGGVYTQMFAAEDGSAVTFYTPAFALPPAERGGTQTYPTYQASRDAAAGSWSSQRLLPPQSFGEKAEYLGSTPDLRYAVVEAGDVGEAGLYLIDTEDDTITQIVPTGLSQSFGFDGASADGSRVFFESTQAIATTPAVPAPVADHVNLYMWERATGNVSLIGVLPASQGGEAPPAGSFGGAYEWYGGESPSFGGALNAPRNVFEPLAVSALHAISPGGDQIFFTSAGTGQIYLRRGLGGPSPSTTYISTPNAGVPGTPGKQPAAFQEATPDGSRAFFLSRQKLTADAKTGSGEKGRDLYRWDASAPASEALTDVAPDPGEPNGAEVQGLLGVSADGSSGYFVARGELAEGAEAGGENLYRFAEKANGRFRIAFIATLAAGQVPEEPDRRNVSPLVEPGAGLVGRTSRLSQDGQTLLFTSLKPLTGYDNRNRQGIACQQIHCPELYLYSARTEKVTCVSCDPTGEVPLGAASLQEPFFDAYFTPSKPPAVFFSRNLSADGTRVFFQTPDPLVAADTNGVTGCPATGTVYEETPTGTGRCQDVYEWEAAGSGTCRAEEADGGCLYLLSTGKSDQPSYFVGASKDGSSAFIATSSQLVPSDRDQADDVYDVREGGGLASQHTGAPEPCRSAEACKGPGSASPTSTSPGTPTFHGPGNESVAPCKKGFVRRHSKCVKKSSGRKKPRHRKRRHHKHSKKSRTTGTNPRGGAR